jgi:sec-independent protein translocase protein TatA
MPFVDNILQPTHLLLILVVALLVLGPKRLPEAGRALGKGIQGFRSAMSGEADGDEHGSGAWHPTSIRSSQPHDEPVSQASSVEAPQPKEPTEPAEPVQPVG